MSGQVINVGQAQTPPLSGLSYWLMLLFLWGQISYLFQHGLLLDLGSFATLWPNGQHARLLNGRTEVPGSNVRISLLPKLAIHHYVPSTACMRMSGRPACCLVFRKKDLYLVITQKLIFMKSGGFHVKSGGFCEIRSIL